MVDMLEQADVDALLAAVGSSERAVENILTAGPKTVTGQVTRYDFKRPERVSKEQMQAIRAMHEGFARSLASSMSTFLRTIVDVRIADTRQLTYDEFIHTLPNPTCLNLISVTPLEGLICLEISPRVVFPVVDRLLGGAHAEASIPPRPLTAIEQRLIGRMIDRALTLLLHAWSVAGATALDVIRTESNPHLAGMIAPNETVVVIGLELALKGKDGMIRLCIPFTMIEPVLNRTAATNWISCRQKSDETDQAHSVAETIHTATVNLRAFLAETKISMSDMMGLEIGDIIQTEKSANSDMVVQVEGRNKFAARLGAFRDNRAVRIVRTVASNERV